MAMAIILSTVVVWFEWCYFTYRLGHESPLRLSSAPH
jgi:hypothetical protein